jgi:hypothetical protein
MHIIEKRLTECGSDNRTLLERLIRQQNHYTNYTSSPHPYEKYIEQIINMKLTDVDEQTKNYYYFYALITSIKHQRKQFFTQLLPYLTIEHMNTLHHKQKYLMHYIVQVGLVEMLYELLPKIVDGLDLFVFDSKPRTPFDMKLTHQNDRLKNFVRFTVTDVWNDIGNEIEKIIYSTIHCLPSVLIELI